LILVLLLGGNQKEISTQEEEPRKERSDQDKEEPTYNPIGDQKKKKKTNPKTVHGQNAETLGENPGGSIY